MRCGVFASVVNGDSRTTESLCRAAAPHRIEFRGWQLASAFGYDGRSAPRQFRSSLVSRTRLHLCAQNALDVATHLALSAGLDAPDYATAIDRLAEMNVLPDDFAAHFRAVAGFRNVLVHGYLDVDLDLIGQLLVRQLDDFETFARHVERWLARLVE